MLVTPPARAPHAAAAFLLAAAAHAALARPAAGQIVGLPAAQTPFGGRPLAVAANVGVGGDGLRSYGGAVGVRAGGSRLMGAFGVAAVQGFATSRTTVGLRVAYLLPLGASGALAAAPFAGYGYLARGDAEQQGRRAAETGRPAVPGNVSVIPAGVSVGYRRVVAGRPVAVHVSPQAQYWRVNANDDAGTAATNRVYLRAAAALDVAVTRQIGLTLAYEAGASSSVTGSGAAATGLANGPRPSTVGVALSYSPGRRRRA